MIPKKIKVIPKNNKRNTIKWIELSKKLKYKNDKSNDKEFIKTWPVQFFLTWFVFFDWLLKIVWEFAM